MINDYLALPDVQFMMKYWWFYLIVINICVVWFLMVYWKSKITKKVALGKVRETYYKPTITKKEDKLETEEIETAINNIMNYNEDVALYDIKKRRG